MIQDRKEYRKSFTSNGSIYLGGEKLHFKGYDISVRGMQIELTQGTLVQNVSDVAQIIESNSTAEIYVDELRLTGEVELIWVRDDEDKILIGLEFRDVMHNAEKLWRKRRYYRKNLVKTGVLIIKDREMDFECKNFSVEGLCLRVTSHEDTKILARDNAKVISEQLSLDALAKIAWVNRNEDDELITLGLRYL
jgi:hypothetical protein